MFFFIIKYYLFIICIINPSYDLSDIIIVLIRFTNFIFYDCKSLISLDLSNFNTQDVIDMSYNSLISLSLDLSNFVI